MRSSLLAALMLSITAAGAAGQTSTPQPPPAGALGPQPTSPGAAAPQAPGAAAAPAPVTPPTNIVSPPPPGRVFASQEGLIFNAIKPDKAADFEMVLAKLRQALETSKNPVRNQQGWGWKIFKATEPGPNGSVLYVFVIDPAVKGADYGVARILAEAYPTEITELYRMYNSAFAPAGQTILNLSPVPAAPTDGTKGLGNQGTGSQVPPSPSPRVP